MRYVLRSSNPAWDDIVTTHVFRWRWYARYVAWVYTFCEHKLGCTNITFYVEPQHV
jgi:hypothetical protein